MRAHYLQHVSFEGLGNIEPLLQSAGYEITNTQFFNSEDLPEVGDIDLLVVMGGPMSVNDEKRSASLKMLLKQEPPFWVFVWALSLLRIQWVVMFTQILKQKLGGIPLKRLNRKMFLFFGFLTK